VGQDRLQFPAMRAPTPSIKPTSTFPEIPPPITRKEWHFPKFCCKMMTRREQLRVVADRFLEFVNTPGEDPEKLSTMAAMDIVTPLTYPGATTGFAGVQGVIQKLHGALSDYSMKALTAVIDEKESKVVFFVKSAGVQTG
jgi:hypothetical protein